MHNCLHMYYLICAVYDPTGLRNYLCPLGDTSRKYVVMGNLMISRQLCIHGSCASWVTRLIIAIMLDLMSNANSFYPQVGSAAACGLHQLHSHSCGATDDHIDGHASPMAHAGAGF